MAADGVDQQAQAENAITGGLRQLFAVAENYPELKANQNFLALQEELTGTESKIAYARQFYNDQVMKLNTLVGLVPVQPGGQGVRVHHPRLLRHRRSGTRTGAGRPHPGHLDVRRDRVEQAQVGPARHRGLPLPGRDRPRDRLPLRHGAARPGDRPGGGVPPGHLVVLLGRQGGARLHARQARDPRRTAAAAQHRRGARDRRGRAEAEGLRGARAGAQRLRHGARPRAFVDRRDRRPAGHDEPGGARGRDRPRDVPRRRPRHPAGHHRRHPGGRRGAALGVLHAHLVVGRDRRTPWQRFERRRASA